MGDYYTSGTIENGTSVTATLIKSHEYSGGGHVKGNYPKHTHSGDTGKFIHHNDFAGADGDYAGIVYRSQNAAGELYDWVFAWYNSFDQQAQPNAVYTDILKPQPYPGSFWDEVYEKLIEGPTKMTTRKFQCQSDVSIDSAALPASFTAKLSTF